MLKFEEAIESKNIKEICDSEKGIQSVHESMKSLFRNNDGILQFGQEIS